MCYFRPPFRAKFPDWSLGIQHWIVLQWYDDGFASSELVGGVGRRGSRVLPDRDELVAGHGEGGLADKSDEADDACVCARGGVHLYCL